MKTNHSCMNSRDAELENSSFQCSEITDAHAKGSIVKTVHTIWNALQWTYCNLY